jgi:hypothetical protein
LLKGAGCVDDVLEPLHPYDLIAHTPHPRDIDFRFGEPIHRDLQYRKIAEHSTPKLVHRPRRAATVRLLAITSRPTTPAPPQRSTHFRTVRGHTPAASATASGVCPL